MDAIPLHQRPTSLTAMLTAIVTMMEPYASDIGVKLKIELPLLFQPAPYQRRRGYALILAREIVEAHGGAMEAESTDDPLQHGTTIRMTLPA